MMEQRKLKFFAQIYVTHIAHIDFMHIFLSILFPNIELCEKNQKSHAIFDVMHKRFQNKIPPNINII